MYVMRIASLINTGFQTDELGTAVCTLKGCVEALILDVAPPSNLRLIVALISECGFRHCPPFMKVADGSDSSVAQRSSNRKECKHASCKGS
eukprot:6328329-Amphidinium_carterae.1